MRDRLMEMLVLMVVLFGITLLIDVFMAVPINWLTNVIVSVIGGIFVFATSRGK